MALGIAMVSSVFHPSIGGAQTHTLRLSQKLMARGIDVLVVTRHCEGLARHEEVGGVPTYRVGDGDRTMVVASLSYTLGALRLLSVLRHRYDILHCHLMISPMTIGLLARMLVGKPLVINPHRSGPIGDVATLKRQKPLIGRLRLATAYRYGDAFVSISREIHAELRGVGVAEQKLWDIPNGIDIEHFHPADPATRAALRRSLALPGGPLVVFAGRLAPEKGLDILLESWPRVLRRLPEARLLLVGEGEQRASLVAQAQRLGIAGEVILGVGCDDVAPYLRAADAFVLPSYAEGLPVALLEAMACGLACVATAIGGTTQVLEDGSAGRLVPAGDPPALAAGIAEALAGPQAQRWALQARRHVAEHYSLDTVVERYVRMYQALLQARDPHPRLPDPMAR